MALLKRIGACLLFTFLLLPFWGDEILPLRKVCVLDVVDLSGSPGQSEAEAIGEIIKDNFSYELGNAGFVILDDKSWKEHAGGLEMTDLLEKDKAVSLGEQAGADVVITQFIRLEGSRILYGIKCYDVEKKLLAASILENGRAGLSLTSTINNTVKAIIPQIKRSMSPLSSRGEEHVVEVYEPEVVDIEVYEPTVNYVSIALKSEDEDALIFSAGALIGKISRGGFSFDVPENSEITILMVKKGYVDKRLILEVGTEPLVHEVPPLKKSIKEALKVEYAMFQLLGAGIGYRYYFRPDWFYAEGLEYLYAQYDFSPFSQLILHNDLNIALGHYIYFDPDFPLRLSLYTGAGVVFTAMFRPEFEFYGDFYRDVLGLNVEWNFGDFILYYKQGGRYAYGGLFLQDLLGNGWWPYTSVYIALGGMIKWH